MIQGRFASTHAAMRAVKLVQRLENQFAGPFVVEGENGGSTELPEDGAQFAGSLDGKEKTVDALTSKRASDGSVGGDHYCFRLQADGMDKRDGVSLAAAGGYHELDSRRFGIEQGAAVAVLTTVPVEGSSVPSMSMAMSFTGEGIVFSLPGTARPATRAFAPL